MTTYENLTNDQLLKLIADIFIGYDVDVYLHKAIEREWKDDEFSMEERDDYYSQLHSLKEAVSEAHKRLAFKDTAPTSRTVHLGDKVLVGLRVATVLAFPDGKLQVLFDDGLRAVVSPNECQSVPSGLYVLPDTRSETGYVFSELPFS